MRQVEFRGAGNRKQHLMRSYEIQKAKDTISEYTSVSLWVCVPMRGRVGLMAVWQQWEYLCLPGSKWCADTAELFHRYKELFLWQGEMSESNV